MRSAFSTLPISAVLLLSSACGEDAGPLPARVQRIVDALDVAMHECPDRAWPNTSASYRRNQVLLVSASDPDTYLWNDLSDGELSPPKVSRLDSDDLGAEWFSVFNIGELERVTTLGVSLDLDRPERWSDSAVVLAFHEGFHFFVQSEWPELDGSRSTPHPVDAGERYLRAMLMRSLSAALADDASTLGAAAFWQERLRSEHGASLERIRRTDIAEGSARYVEVVMQGLAEVGCDASEDALSAAIDAQSSFYLDVPSGGFQALDSESYPLGVASGLVARRRDVSGWTFEVESSTPPVDALLRDQIPEPRADDLAFLAAVEDQVEERNSDVSERVQPLLDQLATPNDYYRLLLPDDWVAGSYSTVGFVQLVEEPGQPEVVLRLEALFEDPDDGAMIEVRGPTALNGVPTPCSHGSGFVVTVARAEIAAAGDRYGADTPALAFADLKASIQMDGEGAEWICPTNAR